MDDDIPEHEDSDLATTRGGPAGFPRLFDRFQVKGKLGKGGMGVVWRAYDEMLECDVALKVLSEVLCADASALDQIKRMTARAMALSHPNIVKIHGLVGDNEAGAEAAIVMEYVAGETLAAMRVDKRDRVFSAVEIAPWIAQLCDALAYAHGEANALHRDLKPANLMVNGAGQLKVSDFGIARSIHDSVSDMALLLRDTAGTLVYMSPQQADGEKPTPMDDIYAVGAVIYELLTGKPPFHSGEIYQQILHRMPPPMADRRMELDVEAPDKIPESWERTVAACLSKDPAQRPQSAAAIWEMLNAPGPKSKASRAGAGGARSRGCIPVLVGVVLFAILLIGAGWWWLRCEEPRRAGNATVVGQDAEDAARRPHAGASVAENAGLRKLVSKLPGGVL